MGKIRHVVLGDEQEEKKQAKRADVRREAKKAKKQKVEGLGLKGGERVSVVEGTDIKPEFKRLVAEVESGEGQLADKKPKNKIADENAKEAKPVTKVRSKKYQEAAKLVDHNKLYPLPEAVKLVKQTSLTKFDGTVEIHLTLNPAVLGEKTDKKDFRASVALPHGSGKLVRVAIADEAVIKEVEAGNINFDILVAHPSMMPKLAKVARVLGPKGLMPNPKNGTVTADVEKRAKELSAGTVNFKSEPNNPLVHLAIGKISFTDQQLTENIQAVLAAVGSGKIFKGTLAATMGPGIKIVIN